jgi:hypothetical protein
VGAVHSINRVILKMRWALPINPDKQTISEPVDISDSCHDRTLPGRWRFEALDAWIFALT